MNRPLRTHVFIIAVLTTMAVPHWSYAQQNDETRARQAEIDADRAQAKIEQLDKSLDDSESAQITTNRENDKEQAKIDEAQRELEDAERRRIEAEYRK